MRRFAFGTLLCPEFTLRDLPRITVRGQTVQGGGETLRKAPLPSRMCPWSTKRPCGPLAFRRATEGSRVLRKMRGSQEGDKKPFGVLSPFCLRRQTAAPPRPWDTASAEGKKEKALPCGRTIGHKDHLFLFLMYSSIAAAALLPAPMARITVAAPVTASPPANTPSLEVMPCSSSATMQPLRLVSRPGVV